MNRQLPGSAEQTTRDAPTFLDVDLPARLAWESSKKDAERARRPLLYIGGTESGKWFAEVRSLVRDWFAEAEDAVIQVADHSLALTHTDQVAAALLSSRRRHPIN